MHRLVDVSDKMKEPSKGNGLSARFVTCDDPFIIDKSCHDVRVLRGHSVNACWLAIRFGTVN